MLKATVPLWNERIDPSDPADAGKKFGGMVLGVIAAIAAIAVGREILQYGANQTGAVEEEQLQVI